MDLIKCRIEGIRDALKGCHDFGDCQIFKTVYEQRNKGIKSDCDGFYLAPVGDSWDNAEVVGTGQFTGKGEVKEITSTYKLVAWFEKSIDLCTAMGVLWSQINRLGGDVQRSGDDVDLIFKEEFPEATQIPDCGMIRIDFEITEAANVGDCFCENIKKIQCTTSC